MPSKIVNFISKQLLKHNAGRVAALVGGGVGLIEEVTFEQELEERDVLSRQKEPRRKTVLKFSVFLYICETSAPYSCSWGVLCLLHIL